MNLLVIVAATALLTAAAVAFLTGPWMDGVVYGLMAVGFMGLWQE